MRGVNRLRRIVRKFNKTSSSSAKKDLRRLDIDRYVSDINHAFLESLAAPDFIDRSGNPKPLYVSINKQVRSIRLALPKKVFFHLHSMVLLDENGHTIKLPKSTRIKLSSRHEKDKLTNTERLELMSSHNGKHELFFHTSDEEDNPNITVTLPRSTYVSVAVIKNITGIHALRAVGLTVEVSEENNSWKNIYDLGGVDDFLARAKEIANKYDLFRYEYGKSTFVFVNALVSSNGNPAVHKLYKKIADIYKPNIRNAINSTVMKERHREWTTHGVKRTFRYYTKKEKQDYIRKTVKLMDDLRGLSKDVSLGFGSVISVVRDQDLLPHDDDMDIVVALKKSQASNLRQAKDLVQKELEDHGYFIKKRGFNHCYVRKDGLKIDVFVGIYDDDNTIGWFPGKRWVLKRSDVFPAKEDSLLGVKCYVPKNPDKYLTSVYGSGWKTPDPTHVHTWRDKSQYIDISGK